MRRTLAPIGFALLAVAGPAVADECRGQFIRASQGYDFGARRPNIVKAGPVVKAGTEALFVGESTIGKRIYFMVARSHMYPGSDVQLPTGCRLMHLDTSEPD